MKALTLWRPWPRAIFDLGKDIENRTWAPPDSLIGHWLAIHAGQKVDGHGVGKVMELERPEGRTAHGMDAQKCYGEAGAIIGIVGVLGWVRYDVEKIQAGKPDGYDWSEGIVLQRAQEWFESQWFSGPYGWILVDKHKLPEPIPCKGRQGLWNVPKPIEDQIAEQLRFGEWR